MPSKTKPERKPLGRPVTLTPEERTKPRTVKLHDEDWETFREMGGAEWLRVRLARYRRQQAR